MLVDKLVNNNDSIIHPDQNKVLDVMREDKEVDMKPVIELLSQREGRFSRWEVFRGVLILGCFLEICVVGMILEVSSWDFFGRFDRWEY